jgi:hypothetical protein
MQVNNSAPAVVDSVVTFVAVVSDDVRDSINFTFGWKDNALLVSREQFTTTNVFQRSYWFSDIFKAEAYDMTVSLYDNNDMLHQHVLAKATSVFLLTGA